jgi:putative nucleotidyltransferase with HDIG domain
MRLFRTFLLLTLLAGAVPTVVLAAFLAQRSEGLPASILAALASSFAGSVLLAALVARRLVTPLEACVRGALEIARGRFGRQVEVGARNEIGDLAYTFNHMSRELASYDGENRRLIAALEQGYLDTIRSLAGAIDAKDPYTRGHAQRVADLSVEIGRELRLGEREQRALAYAGILHDIGKIGVPEPLLGKVAPLSGPELEVMRAHPVIGAEIVKGVEFLRDAAPAIRSHHERWDGTGYPDRLRGEAIPLVARIVNAADTWDACTSERPYQAALPPDEVLSILASLRGTQIDPAVHDALLRVLRRRGALPAERAA